MNCSREQLLELIEEWNASRLDLFHLSIPDDSMEFRGVMRFFFEDAGKRYQTKCLRVSSTSKAIEIVQQLLEKFQPILGNRRKCDYGLFEHHAMSERRLNDDESPLMVQLNWCKQGREGKLILKCLREALNPEFSSSREEGKTEKIPLQVKRNRWPLKRDKKHLKSLPHGAQPACSGRLLCTRGYKTLTPGMRPISSTNKPLTKQTPNLLGPEVNVGFTLAQSLEPTSKGNWRRGSSPPDNSFTRTVSDPEAMMRRKRQQTLGAKLARIAKYGGGNRGGTVKIFGDMIDPNVPYKTLLLSVEDTVSQVIREALDKYGLEDADPASYCLVMRSRFSKETANCPAHEEILSDTASPLGRLLMDKPPKGVITTFELRPRLHRDRSSEETSNGPLLALPDARSSGAHRHLPAYSRLVPHHSLGFPPCSPETVFAWLVEFGKESPVDVGNTHTPCRKPASYPLHVDQGPVYIGTAPYPTAETPQLVSLPPSLHPEVCAIHLVIWQPARVHELCRNVEARSSPRGPRAWLACTPCTANAPVFVNGRRLLPATEPPRSSASRQQLNHSQSLRGKVTAHWLGPGDVIQLGNGSSRFRVWAGARPLTLPSLRPQPAESSPLLVKSFTLQEQVAGPHQSVSPHRTWETSTSGRIHYSPWNRSNLSPPFLHPPTRTPLPNWNGEQLKTVLSHENALNVLSTDSVPTTRLLSACTENAQPTFRLPVDRSVSMASSTSPSPPHSPLTVFSPQTSQTSSAGTMSSISQVVCSPSGPSSRCNGVLVNPDPSARLPSYDSIVNRAKVQQVDGSESGNSAENMRPLFEPALNSTASASFSESASTVTVETEPKGAYPQTQPCLSPLASPEPVSSPPSAVAGATTSPLVDQLPCQLAYAPASLDNLLDWLLLDQLGSSSRSSSQSERTDCPLGPTFTIYLMFRAICRQCDRWDSLEANKATTDKETLRRKQRQRRQQQLLGLLVSVVDRFIATEQQLVEISFLGDKEEGDNCTMSVEKEKQLDAAARRAALVLANASQLLHFVSRDVDLQAVFQPISGDDDNGDNGVYELESSVHPAPEGEVGCANAWFALNDRLAQVIETTFECLVGCFTSVLGRRCLGEILQRLDSEAAALCDHSAVEDEPCLKDAQPDPVLVKLTDALEILHTNAVNPAFMVQLLSRLLHFIGAHLFNELIRQPVRVSPQWGRLLHPWVHKRLAVWAEKQGLGLAVDCYLSRLSQAADLMQANVGSVETLYNIVVDLDRLNSVQVRHLLETYRPEFKTPLRLPCHTGSSASEYSMSRSESILPQWIDFIISGVIQVSDRILAEEHQANQEGTGEDGGPECSWTPELYETLELRLPLLLPEDCFPSEVPVRNPCLSPPISDEAAQDRSRSENDVRPVEVANLVSFLRPALSRTWCRLSMRPPKEEQETSTSTMSWAVYLIPDGDVIEGPPSTAAVTADAEGPAHAASIPQTEANEERGLSFGQPQSEVDSRRQIPTSNAFPADSDHVSSLRTTEDDHDGEAINGTQEQVGEDDDDEVDENVRVYSVLVPKIDNSLGLSIVAARAEDGRDLGIYVKSVVPGGGASQARWLCTSPMPSDEVFDSPPLQPGDRILAVNGRPMAGLSQESAARLVSTAGCEVHLKVARNLGLGCVAAAAVSERRGSRSTNSALSTPVRRETITEQLAMRSDDRSHSADQRSRRQCLESDQALTHRSAALQTKPKLSADTGQVGIVLSRSVSTPRSVTHPVEYVEVATEESSPPPPPPPRLLVETSSLIAHEVKAPPLVARSLDSASGDWISHFTPPDQLASVDRGEILESRPVLPPKGGLRRAATISYATKITAPIAVPDDDYESDLELKRLQANGVPSNGLSPKDWADVESTLEMLREMRDELDRSLAYRTERRNALNAGYRPNGGTTLPRTFSKLPTERSLNGSAATPFSPPEIPLHSGWSEEVSYNPNLLRFLVNFSLGKHRKCKLPGFNVHSKLLYAF
uniref:Afadin n=1 Tax=Schistocephalus solidus TaxID=70667 RepID=A0A0X3PXU4_SCHSO